MRTTSFAFVFSFALALMSASAHGDVLLDMNISWDGANPRQQGSTHASGVIFSTSVANNTDRSIREGLGGNVDVGTELAPIAWTDGAFSGTVHVSFNLSATGTPTAMLDAGAEIVRGGRGAVGIGSDSGTDSVLGTDEGSLTLDTILITQVSGDAFTFDGITGVYLGNGSDGETATTNGVVTNNHQVGGATVAGGFNALTGLPTSIEVVATSGEISLNGVQLQITGITGVPEPTSFAMFLGGGIGMLTMRRRRI